MSDIPILDHPVDPWGTPWWYEVIDLGSWLPGQEGCRNIRIRFGSVGQDRLRCTHGRAKDNWRSCCFACDDYVLERVLGIESLAGMPRTAVPAEPHEPSFEMRLDGALWGSPVPEKNNNR
jgi:hypothetical protein